MKVEINVTESFKRAARPLIKRYSSFVDDLAQLEAELIENPDTGTALGQGVYKIRYESGAKERENAAGLELFRYWNEAKSAPVSRRW